MTKCTFEKTFLVHLRYRILNILKLMLYYISGLGLLDFLIYFILKILSPVNNIFSLICSVAQQHSTIVHVYGCINKNMVALRDKRKLKPICSIYLSCSYNGVILKAYICVCISNIYTLYRWNNFRFCSAQCKSWTCQYDCVLVNW